MDSDDEAFFFSDEEEEAGDDESDFQMSGDGGAVSDDDDDEAFDDDDDDFAEELPKAKKKAAPKAKASKAKAAPKKAPAKKAASPKKASKAKAATKDDDDDDEPATPASSTGGKKRGTKRAAPAAKAPAAKKQATGKKAASGAGGKGSVKESDAGPVVVDYLNSTNRPYNTINVFDNLHGIVKRAALQRVLDAEAAKGTINIKQAGKAKIYWALQDQFGEITPADIKALAEEVKELTVKAREAAEARATAQATHDALAAAPSDAELEEQLASTAAEVKDLEARYDAAVASANGVVVSAADKDALVAKGKAYRKHWSNLRGKVLEVVGRMGEGMNKSTKQLFDIIGMERDSEYGVDIKTLKF